MQVVLYLLDMHRTMDSDGRKDPVKVARAITEMVRTIYMYIALHLHTISTACMCVIAFFCELRPGFIQ